MRRYLAVVSAAVCCVACTSGSQGKGDASSTAAAPTSAPYSRPAPPSYTTATDAAAGTCALFQAFLSDMESAPPSEQVGKLQDEGANIVRSAAAAVRLDPGSAAYKRLSAKVDALYEYLVNPSFRSQGNVLGAPIQAMQQDCP